MSGSIGADRIKKESVESTLKFYIDKVLKKYTYFKDAKISGSYNTGLKADYGDIDLIVYLNDPESDKKIVKRNFGNFLNSFPDNIIIPFKFGKHIGDKVAGIADNVMIQLPNQLELGKTVQVDNMIVTSLDEAIYRKSFLDYPAEIQGLLIGLVKVVMIEENPKMILKKLGINKLSPLKKNQEYEFNLSSKGLELRKVTLSPDFKEINRESIWKSINWNDVRKLLQNYNIDGSFEDLLLDIKKFKNPRSLRRIKGLFKSLVILNPGERGTPKGNTKEKNLATIAALTESKRIKLKDLL